MPRRPRGAELRKCEPPLREEPPLAGVLSRDRGVLPLLPLPPPLPTRKSANRLLVLRSAPVGARGAGADDAPPSAASDRGDGFPRLPNELEWPPAPWPLLVRPKLCREGLGDAPVLPPLREPAELPLWLRDRLPANRPARFGDSVGGPPPGPRRRRPCVARSAEEAPWVVHPEAVDMAKYVASCQLRGWMSLGEGMTVDEHHANTRSLFVRFHE